jgi:anaerobic nitric oxide reductase flavorubredoxin
MNTTKVAEGTYQLTVNVEDILFEGVWDMPEGVSLNSYIVKGDKTVIIDGVCGWDGFAETFYELLEETDVSPASIEYVIINHMEPDHSGWIEDLKKLNANFKILCSKKSAELLEAFYDFTDNVICVGDGDTLDLGKGHVLSFVEIPNVHWPDTIATFDNLTGTLFSCDAFGSFGKIQEAKFDDMLSDKELAFYEKETIRYYSNILATFSLQVKKAVEKCAALPVKIIAPGHGLMWKNPEKIMKAYAKYADYQKGPARKEITLIWSSMYGMTEKAVKRVIPLLEQADIKVHIHQVPESSYGEVLTSAWTSTGIIIAMPTYEYKMFPPMAAMLEELGKKRVFNRRVFRFGSYGWSGGAQKELDEIISRYKMNWEFLEPVEFRGSPREDELVLIEERVKMLIEEILGE